MALLGPEKWGEGRLIYDDRGLDFYRKKHPVAGVGNFF